MKKKYRLFRYRTITMANLKLTYKENDFFEIEMNDNVELLINTEDIDNIEIYSDIDLHNLLKISI